MSDNKLLQVPDWICPCCQENETEHGLLCWDCAEYFSKEADRQNLISRCDW